MSNKWSELQFRAIDADVMTVTETWLQLGEREIKLMAWEYSFFRMNREDGRMRGGTLILVAEK